MPCNKVLVASPLHLSAHLSIVHSSVICEIQLSLIMSSNVYHCIHMLEDSYGLLSQFVQMASPLPCILTHTHVLAFAHRPTRESAYTHAHTQAHTLTHMCTCAHAHTCGHICMQTHAHTHTHMCTCAHTHSRPNARCVRCMQACKPHICLVEWFALSCSS